MEDIIYSVKDSIGVITLNRPKALNALTFSMILSMKDQLKHWESDPSIQSVLIHSLNPRAFCAGGDIRAVYEAKQNGIKDLATFFKEEYELNELIKNYTKPYIAIMNGITMGGGIGISIHGSLKIATESLVFAMPETAIGFFPDIGASYFLSRAPGELGTYIALTGYRLNANDAIYTGFIDHIILDSDKDRLLDSFPKSIHSFFINKNHLASTLYQYHPMIDSCFSENSIEAILNNLKNLANDWANETIKILQTKSPTSLKITLEELRRAKSLNFHECLQMEYQLASHFMQNPDFFEGVRALIIDKDNQPNWQPESLEKVDNPTIDRYFSAPDDTGVIHE